MKLVKRIFPPAPAPNYQIELTQEEAMLIKQVLGQTVDRSNDADDLPAYSLYNCFANMTSEVEDAPFTITIDPNRGYIYIARN